MSDKVQGLRATIQDVVNGHLVTMDYVTGDGETVESAPIVHHVTDLIDDILGAVEKYTKEVIADNAQKQNNDRVVELEYENKFLRQKIDVFEKDIERVKVELGTYKCGLKKEEVIHTLEGKLAKSLKANSVLKRFNSSLQDIIKEELC